MYYDKDTKAPSPYANDQEDQRVLAWQRDVAKSTASEASRLQVQPTPVERIPTQIIINQIVQPAVVVTRTRPEEPKPTDEISTRAIVGTILGATAGAVVAYAMTKGDSESHQQPHIQRKITYRTIEAPAAQNLVRQDALVRNGSLPNSNSIIRTIPIDSSPRTRVNTLPATSEHSRRSYPTVVRSADAGPVIQTTNGTRISIGQPKDSRTSHISSSSKTIRQADLAPKQPTVITVKSAKDIPLPASMVSTREREEPNLDDRSVHPNDSVSQVSTRRDGKSKHRHGGSKAGSEKDHGNRAEKSSKAGSRKETSSKISAVRSPGMKGALGF